MLQEYLNALGIVIGGITLAGFAVIFGFGLIQWFRHMIGHF